MLLTRAITYARASRAAARSSAAAAKVKVQPVAGRTRLALALLAALCAGFLAATLPRFTPENIFAETESRLQIPADVLFARVAATLRHATAGSAAVLTAADEALRAKFVNLENRLLYLKFGPAVMAECPFCIADEPTSYLYYALPAILTPHLANLVALALVTSPVWTGRAGARWRIPATVAALVMAAVDVYITVTYDTQTNARALRFSELDFFFWTARSVRYMALAALDALAALLIYLAATNRAFVQLPSPAERVETAARVLATVKSRINAAAIIKNTAQRDDDLRLRAHAYWSHEVNLMRHAMEDRDVVDSVSNALGSRIDIQAISRDADAYSDGVLQQLRHDMPATGAYE